MNNATTRKLPDTTKPLLDLGTQQRDLERGILGILLRQPQHYADLEKLIRSEYFVFPAHRIMFDVMRGLWMKGRPVDMVVMANELMKLGLIEEVGGYPAIAELWDLPGGVHAFDRAGLLRESFLSRQLVCFASDLLLEVSKPHQAAPEILRDYQARLMSIETEVVDNRVQSAREVADAVRRGIEETETGKAPRGILSGFHDFDFLTRGFKPGQFVVVGGRPGYGKSAILSNMATHIAEGGRQVLICSLEMPNAELGLRIFSARAEVDTYDISGGNLDQPRRDSLDEAHGYFSRLPITFSDAAHQSLTQIQSTARKLKTTTGLDVVFVDYLQLATAGAAKYQNRQEAVADISRTLKGMAMELGITVVAAAQLSRSCVDAGRAPTLTDLKESGQIEQDCDIIAFVYPENWNDEDAKLKPWEDRRLNFEVAKHRGGQTGMTTLLFRKKFVKFENVSFDQ